MKRLLSSHRAKLAVSVVAIGVLSGCASVSLEQNVNRVNTETTGFTDGQLSLAQSNQEREQRAQLAAQLLAKPLGQKEAVQLALTNSHALQALLAQGWAESADAAQVGRIANPIFSFERMVVGDELELARSLSFGLLDLLTLPARTGIAERRIEQAQLRLSAEVVDRVTQVRQAWVRAVAAQQALSYARQVFESAEAGAERTDILDMVFVGNPVMHHLFLGIDPTELGGAPFALAASGALSLKASDIGIDANPGARVYVLPCIAGHVGADAAAATLSEGPYRQDAMMLLVDVGTNAEIVLGNKARTVACSSPTGPAFEGAEISGGQRAAPGAIERVRIDPVTLEPRYRVIGVEPWSDEPGFAEAAGTTGVTGICGSGIIEVIAEMYLAGIISEDGVVDGSLAARSPRIVENGRTFSYVVKEGAPRIAITQNDVRAIQLAKAALYAGVKLLMQKQGVDHVDTIRFAGAFGSFIDPKYAMVLGLIPDCELSEVKAVGNAAGDGALMALLNRGHRREIEDTVRRIEKIETALEPDFQALFVAAMAIPNKLDPFPKLSAEVTLPPRKILAEGESGGRRGGRRGR
jgi:uncharacterized 2Fe-2S/4Fe-4S cluster protein (DUF4445 family)